MKRVLEMFMFVCLIAVDLFAGDDEEEDLFAPKPRAGTKKIEGVTTTESNDSPTKVKLQVLQICFIFQIDFGGLAVDFKGPYWQTKLMSRGAKQKYAYRRHKVLS